MDFIRTYLPQLFIGLGVLLSFIGGFLAFKRTNENNTAITEISGKNKKLSERNLILTGENQDLINRNIGLSEINKSLSEKNIELSQINIELSENITKQSEIINSNITGGDSYCNLQLSFVSSDEYRLVLINYGEYPLYNLQARLFDLDLLKRNEKLNYETLTKDVYHIDVLNGKMARIIGTINLRDKPKKAGYNIFYDAKNGSFTQLLRLRKENDIWYQASRIERDGEIILSKIDDEFPKLEPDEDIWKY